MQVKSDLSHDVMYICAEFEGIQQSFRGPTSGESTHNSAELTSFHTVSHLAALLWRFIKYN